LSLSSENAWLQSLSLSSENQVSKFAFQIQLVPLHSGNAAETSGVCAELQELVRQLRPTDDVMHNLAATLGATYGAKVMVGALYKVGSSWPIA
jgi:hypothetical protein